MTAVSLVGLAVAALVFDVPIVIVCFGYGGGWLLCILVCSFGVFDLVWVPCGFLGLVRLLIVLL